MSTLCYKCNEELDDDSDDYTECDGCDRNFHLSCLKIPKKDYNSRKGSKCLRLYCSVCIETECTTEDKIKEIAKMLYKLDLHNQNQVAIKQTENETMSNVISHLKALEDKVDKLESGSAKHLSNETQTHTYANAVKRSNVKPAVVIKPKNKQQSKKTLEDISTKVNVSALDVCGTRKMRDGGVVLRCNNTTDTMKIKQMVNEKLGDSYEVVLPKIKMPRLRITNIDPELEKDDILDKLKHHNQSIQCMDIQIIAVIGRKYRDNVYNDIVVEVNGAAYKQLMEMGKLRLPWRECKVFEHLYLVRCYKCCGFLHKSSECKKSQKCSNCSGQHKFAECKSKIICCVNCKDSNNKYKTKLDTKHNAWSKECQILKRHHTKLANKIEYSDNE